MFKTISIFLLDRFHSNASESQISVDRASQCSSRNVDKDARHDAMNCCPLPVIRACKCVHLPVRRLHLPPPPPPSCTSRCTRGFPSVGCDASPHFVYGGYVSRPWERLGVRHPFQVSQTSIIAAIETLP